MWACATSVLVGYPTAERRAVGFNLSARQGSAATVARVESCAPVLAQQLHYGGAHDGAVHGRDGGQRLLELDLEHRAQGTGHRMLDASPR